MEELKAKSKPSPIPATTKQGALVVLEQLPDILPCRRALGLPVLADPPDY